MSANQTSFQQRYSLILYFLLTYLISWSFMIPIALSQNGLINVKVPLESYYLAPYGPFAAAVIVTAITEGGKGVGKLLSRLVKWRVGFRYYAFAVMGPVGLFLFAGLVNFIVTDAWPDMSLLGEADYLPYLTPIGTLALWIFTYSIGEETGWRGFALPHLQRNRSAASASLILAIFWAIWHIPAFFFRDTYTDLGVLGYPMFFISIICTTMIFTWLYNSTGGSLLIVVLLHAFFNWLSVSEAGGQFVAPIMSIPVILWSLYVPRKYGLENVSPIPKQVA